MNIASILKADYIGIKELKTNLCKIIDKNKPCIVTERGKPKQFMIPYEEMVEIIEILEELANPEIIQEIQSARKSCRGGGGISLNKLWKELGIS